MTSLQGCPGRNKGIKIYNTLRQSDFIWHPTLICPYLSYHQLFRSEGTSTGVGVTIKIPYTLYTYVTLIFQHVQGCAKILNGTRSMQMQTGITTSYYFNGIGTLSQMSAHIVRTY